MKVEDLLYQRECLIEELLNLKLVQDRDIHKLEMQVSQLSKKNQNKNISKKDVNISTISIPSQSQLKPWFIAIFSLVGGICVLWLFGS